MNLQETLRAIHKAAQTFEGGTQITSVGEAADAALSLIMFEELIAMAKRKGATGYEIERAMQGEFIGNSFT
jgi:hypothetical protein